VCVCVIIFEQFFYLSDIKRFVYCNCNVTFVSSGENYVLIILKTVQLLCAYGLIYRLIVLWKMCFLEICTIVG